MKEKMKNLEIKKILFKIFEDGFSMKDNQIYIQPLESQGAHQAPPHSQGCHSRDRSRRKDNCRQDTRLCNERIDSVRLHYAVALQFR